MAKGTETAGEVEIQGETPKFTRWHLLTLSLLVFGYAAYYFCRSDLSVVMPLLIKDLAQHGVTTTEAQVRLGSIASISVLAYAIGKFLWGSLADLFGGRNNFLAGMAGAIAFTVLFGLGGGFPIFTLAWIGNRAFQSAGWVGMVKVSSRWFSYSICGTVMAVLSLSFLFGDAASRYGMSLLLDAGVGWRGIFFTGAGILGVFFLLNLILLKETPQERGLPAAIANPLNLFAGTEKSPESGAAIKSAPKAHPGLMGILGPLLTSGNFWLVCGLSLGTTLLRETFNLWTPTYFSAFVGLTNAESASRSALFPLFGGVSVLLAGFLSDKLGLNGRSLVLFGGLLSGAAAICLLAQVPSHSSPWIPVTIVALIGFLLMGPYSYLAGAMSMDFGGETGSATAAGIIDGVGYLAGVLSGDTMARFTVLYGWRSSFLALGVTCLGTALVALVLAIQQRRQAQIRLAAGRAA